MHYDLRPTIASLFLVCGWASIMATGWFLATAVRVMDGVDTEETLADDERPGGRRREELLREKKLLLKAIKEVEFDQATGKIDDGDAAAAISRYRARALEIIALTQEDGEEAARATVERELARRLAKRGAARGPCAGCQTVNDADAAFCKKCGAKI